MFSSLTAAATKISGEKVLNLAERLGELVAPPLDDEEDDYDPSSQMQFAPLSGGSLPPPPLSDSDCATCPALLKQIESLQYELQNLESHKSEESSSLQSMVLLLSTENSDLKQSVASAASFEENNRTLESSMLSLQQIKSELAVQLVEEKATSQQLRQQLSQPQPSPPPASSPPASSPPSLPQTPASKAVQSASESESHELQLLKEMRDQEREEELSSREKKLEEERDRSSSEMSSLKAKLVQSQRAAQNASVETSRKEQEIADLKQKLTQLTTESAQNDSAAELTQLREALAAEKETSVMRLTRVQNESSIGIKKASDDTARSLQENTQLHEVIKNMKMAMSRSSDDSATYEKMYTDLQQEYKGVLEELQQMKVEKEEAEAAVESLESEAEKNAGSSMEMKLNREELTRKTEEVKKLTAERDNAVKNAHETGNRFAASAADLEIAVAAQTASSRAMDKLEAAMVSLQNERDQELSMVEESHAELITGERRAFEVKIVAMEELYKSKERGLVEKMKGDVDVESRKLADFERKHAAMRAENVSLRRSLDEAIKRLQQSTEDVIDRAVIKSMLLDWHSKVGGKRMQVMEVICSILNMSEEEKGQCEVWGKRAGEEGGLVGKVFVPLPEGVVKNEDLAGDTVKDKFLSFLMSETGDI